MYRCFSYIDMYLSHWCRQEQRSSVGDLRLELQDLEKYSIINRFAKFHVRSQSNGSGPSSCDPFSYPSRPMPEKCVVAIPMPRNLPDNAQCLSLWPSLDEHFPTFFCWSNASSSISILPDTIVWAILTYWSLKVRPTEPPGRIRVKMLRGCRQSYSYFLGFGSHTWEVTSKASVYFHSFPRLQRRMASASIFFSSDRDWHKAYFWPQSCLHSSKIQIVTACCTPIFSKIFFCRVSLAGNPTIAGRKWETCSVILFSARGYLPLQVTT